MIPAVHSFGITTSGPRLLAGAWKRQTRPWPMSPNLNCSEMSSSCINLVSGNQSSSYLIGFIISHIPWTLKPADKVSQHKSTHTHTRARNTTQNDIFSILLSRSRESRPGGGQTQHRGANLPTLHPPQVLEVPGGSCSLSASLHICHTRDKNTDSPDRVAVRRAT